VCSSWPGGSRKHAKDLEQALPKIHESGSVQDQEAAMPDDPGKDRSWNDPARNTAKPDLEQMGTVASPHFKPQKPQIWRSPLCRCSCGDPDEKPLEAGAAPEFCHTAFSGVALECPVAKRYGTNFAGQNSRRCNEPGANQSVDFSEIFRPRKT
jgi:hypothetical protein